MPSVFPVFDQNKVTFRRSSIHMIAGCPGSMKSMLTLDLAVRMGVPTLYFSSDSDDFTMTSRLLAKAASVTTDEAEGMMRDDPDFCSSVLDDYDHIRWNFLPSPNLDDIWHEAEAYLELYGSYPHLTVIDIAMDVDHQDGDEFATLRSLMREMKRYARDTESGVLVVHHTSEAVPGNPCQPRSAIMGKIAQLPVLILTTGIHSNGNQLDVAVVKNRFGKGPADASLRFHFDVEGDRCSIEEHVEKPQAWAPSAWGGNYEDND